MTNLPTAQSNVMTVLKDNWKTIKNVLPSHLTPERMARIAYTAISKNQNLMQCSPSSLANAVIESSMLGLELGGPIGMAYLVPFKKEATLIIGYKGFMDLAYRSGIVTNFSAHPVYEHDHFEYSYGLNPKLEHRPSNTKRGNLEYAYAVCNFKNGGYDFEVVNELDIAATKRKSAGSKRSDSPWNDNDVVWTMWVKTAIRRLAKRIPQSPDILRAASLDETADMEISQGLDHIIDIEPDINDIIEPVSGAKFGIKTTKELKDFSSTAYDMVVKELGLPKSPDDLEKFNIRFDEIIEGE